MLKADQVEEPAEGHQVNLRGRQAFAAKNRGRLDVVADVLSACSQPASKNMILIRANVNSVTGTRMLAQLMGTRLVDTVVDDEERVTYIATKRGVAYLNEYRSLTQMLSSALVPDTKSARPELGVLF